MLAAPIKTEQEIGNLWDEFAAAGCNPGLRMSISEWWPESRCAGWDSLALESTLWSSILLNVYQRNPVQVESACRTFFALTPISIDSNDYRREVIVTPLYHAFKLYRRHSGTKSLETEIDCGSYDLTALVKSEKEIEIPYLDVSATRSEDHVYLAVVNRDPRQTVDAEIRWEGLELSDEGTAYELTASSYLDRNDLANPDEVHVNCREYVPSRSYRFPAHSLTILEVPI